MEVSNINLSRKEQSVLMTLRDEGVCTLRQIGGQYMRNLMIDLTRSPKKLVCVSSGQFWLSDRGKEWLNKNSESQSYLTDGPRKAIPQEIKGWEGLKRIESTLRSLVSKMNDLEDRLRALEEKDNG